MKALKENKQAYDKFLLDFSIGELTRDNELLKNHDFREQYQKDDDESFRLTIGMCMICWSEKMIKKKFPEIRLVPSFASYFIGNMLVYNILRTGNFKGSLLLLIRKELESDNKKAKYVREGLVKHFKEGFDLKNILFFFPALRWFLSEKTMKHYPKKLLDDMKRYESELQKVKHKDMIEEYDNTLRIRY